MISSVAPNALHASVCDEQLLGIGGEIALSRNTVKYSTMLFFIIYIDGHFSKKIKSFVLFYNF